MHKLELEDKDIKSYYCYIYTFRNIRKEEEEMDDRERLEQD